MTEEIDALIKKYEGELQSNPDNVEIMTKLGTYYISINNYDKAIELFNKILEKEPKNLDVLNNIGIAYTQNGKLTDAITKLEIAVKLYPNNSKLWNNLSEAYRRAENYHKANVCRMRAIQLSETEKSLEK
ncbi:MAG: tetratricopeptide repeat protein [Candidatus Helarchaeota archaeon]